MLEIEKEYDSFAGECIGEERQRSCLPYYSGDGDRYYCRHELPCSPPFMNVDVEFEAGMCRCSVHINWKDRQKVSVWRIVRVAGMRPGRCVVGQKRAHKVTIHGRWVEWSVPKGKLAYCILRQSSEGQILLPVNTKPDLWQS